MLNAALGASARRNSLAQVRLDPAANVPLLAALLDIPLPTMLPTNMWPPPSQVALPPTEPSRETPPGMNMPAEGP
jgi:hypothetical protein